MTIIRVALDVPVDKLFDYRAPDADSTDVGRRVAVPYVGHAAAGTTAVDWTFTGGDGAPLSSGVYFARLVSAGRSTVLRVVALVR